MGEREAGKIKTRENKNKKTNCPLTVFINIYYRRNKLTHVVDKCLFTFVHYHF